MLKFDKVRAHLENKLRVAQQLINIDLLEDAKADLEIEISQTCNGVSGTFYYNTSYLSSLPYKGYSLKPGTLVELAGVYNTLKDVINWKVETKDLDYFLNGTLVELADNGSYEATLFLDAIGYDEEEHEAEIPMATIAAYLEAVEKLSNNKIALFKV